MDNSLMIQKLKEAGIRFAPALEEAEISRAEMTFGFRFPREIRSFLSCGVPLGEEFFDWRDLSQANVEKFHGFQQKIRDTFLFDIAYNEQPLRELLGEACACITEKDAFARYVMEALEKSPRLIPFYANRCFFDGMDGMPVVSFWQAVDTIFYGSDFEHYLENEFLRDPWDPCQGQISQDMKNTGIWHLVVEE